MNRAAGLLFMMAVVFCGFVGLALAGRLLLLGWLWALLPLNLNAAAAQAAAIVLSLATAGVAYRLFVRWWPKSGPKTTV